MDLQIATTQPISAWTKRTRLTVVGLIVIGVAAPSPIVAQAATFIVNSRLDIVNAAPGEGVCATAITSLHSPPPKSFCTLRAAIQEANALPGGPHMITLPAGTYTLTIPGRDEDAAARGDLDITASMIINGAGAATTIIDAKGIDAKGIDRVFQVMAGAVVTISGVTITRGDVHPQPGVADAGGIRNAGTLILNDTTVSGNTPGGISNIGTLTLNNSTVSGNDGDHDSGGIFNSGTLTLNNSTVSGNNARGIGGIRSTGGAVTLNNSTVSGNVASQNIAGGILYECGLSSPSVTTTLTLNNSTVSGNSAGTYGGGIVVINIADAAVSACRSAPITLNNSTVSANRAGGDGGGITQDPRNTNPATIRLKNSIVAGNTGNPNANCSGTMTSLGHNIAGDASCALTGTGDRNNIDPLLGPLANNGGPTQTHAPLPGSPAIDAVLLANCTNANDAPIATDQRGVARPQGAACDIGSVDLNQAFEYAVKFVCGRAVGTAAVPSPVSPGFYFTAINVHSPSSGAIDFRKKFAQALPNQKAGKVSQFFGATLKADEAFEVECAEITSKLGLPQLSFVTGFAVFQSLQELDIVAVYTAATAQAGPVVTMHTERVPKRP